MLGQTPLNISVKTDVIGKLDKSEIGLKMADNWTNVQFSYADFLNHLTNGYPYGYQWEQGIRKSNYFKKTNIISVDFDNGLIPIHNFIDNDFIKHNASIIYKTASHTEEKHRYRAIFVLPKNINDVKSLKVITKGLYQKLTNIFKLKSASDFIDTSTYDGARFFFGNLNSLVFNQNTTIHYNLLDELRILGSKEFSEPIELIRSQDDKIRLTKDTPIKLASGNFAPLMTLNVNQSVHCPFHSPDKHPSAMVVKSEAGVLGIHCRTCKTTKFSEPLKHTKYNFFKFDDLVKNNINTLNKFYNFSILEKAFGEAFAFSHEAYLFKQYNQKFISIDFSPKGIHFIKSPKGTGKTVLIETIVRKAKFEGEIFNFHKNKKHYKKIPVLVVGHRQALLAEMCKRLDIECYLDTGNYDFKLNEKPTKSDLIRTLKPDFYGISVDSLWSRMRPQQESFPIIIIDESEQVFSHFNAGSLKNKNENFEILKHYIQNASHVYCLDADLGEISIEGIASSLKEDSSHYEKMHFIYRNNFLKSQQIELTNDHNYFPKEEISIPTYFKSNLFFHLNTFLPEAGKLILFEKKSEITSHIEKSILDGKKCFIVSNSKSTIQKLTAYIENEYPKYKVFSVTSDNSNQIEIKEQISNIINTVKTHDVVLASPSLGTGIDITFENNERIVDCVYGIFNSHTNTHFDIDQQLGRVRHPKQVYVWVSAKKQSFKPDENLIKSNLKDNTQVFTNLHEISSDGITYKTSNDPFMCLITKIKKIQYESFNYFKENFIELKKRNGWTIGHFKKNDLMREKGEKISNDSFELNLTNQFDLINSAKDISEDEYQLIQTKKNQNKPISRDDYMALKKFSFKKFYNVDNINLDLFTFDDGGKSREAVRLFEIMTLSDIVLLKSRNDIQNFINRDLFYKHLEDGHSSKTFNRESFTKLYEKSKALTQIFETAGILKNRVFITNQKWNNFLLMPFRDLCKIPNNYANYQRLFNFSIRRDIDFKTCTQFHRFIKILRFDVIQIERNKGNQKGTYTYILCPAKLNFIQDIVKRRINTVI
jgi:hypothetical protein